MVNDELNRFDDFDLSELDANDFNDINEEFYDDIVMEQRKNHPRLDFIRMAAMSLSANACAKMSLFNISVEWCREWSICSECGRVVYANEILVISKSVDTYANKVAKVHRCEKCGLNAINMASKIDDEEEKNMYSAILDDYIGGY